MQVTRIIELLQPFLTPACEQQLTARDYECISIYIDILQRWNARINLTAVRNEEEIVTRHFGESFFAASNLFPGRGGEEGELKEPGTRKVVARSAVADIGSGAGFPGIPIKLWAPSVALTLIESNHKKAAFLREVTRFLRLTGINVQSARAEHIDQTFDFVILRAVERFTDILPSSNRLHRSCLSSFGSRRFPFRCPIRAYSSSAMGTSIVNRWESATVNDSVPSVSGSVGCQSGAELQFPASIARSGGYHRH
jgi:16S rRNA (guanine527-N7)-methyltransferase